MQTRLYYTQAAFPRCFCETNAYKKEIMRIKMFDILAHIKVFDIFAHLPESTQRAHDVIQRRINVDATSWRCIDADATLYNCYVPTYWAQTTIIKQKNSTSACAFIVRSSLVRHSAFCFLASAGHQTIRMTCCKGTFFAIRHFISFIFCAFYPCQPSFYSWFDCILIILSLDKQNISSFWNDKNSIDGMWKY